eukprot:c10730_g1_i2.p1 GENE.c10730_g1_i2~~c10730_g1_i2.p1  ORF type:complete len:648 (+),score=101.51 c10730_g1_i2:47-1945(+)
MTDEVCSDLPSVQDNNTREILETCSAEDDILKWCQCHFLNFTRAPRVCKTWVDTDDPAIFLGTCTRALWDSTEGVFAVLGNFHSARPVLVQFDRCDFEVARVVQLSEHQYKVWWETGEVTTESTENIAGVLKDPKCEVQLLSCKPSSSRKRRLAGQDGPKSAKRPVNWPSQVTSDSPQKPHRPDFVDAPTVSPPDSSSALTDKEQIDMLAQCLAVASPNSLWEQLLRLYPRDIAQNIALEHCRLVGDRGCDEILKSPPARALPAAFCLFIDLLFRSTRGFNLFVDSFVLGACCNVHPITVAMFLKHSGPNTNLPPHPSTVLAPLLANHMVTLLHIVDTIPSQWIHFLKCDRDLFHHFAPLSAEARSVLRTLQSTLKSAIDFIKLEDWDHMPIPASLDDADDTDNNDQRRLRRSNVAGSCPRRARTKVGYVIDDITRGFALGPIPAINRMNNELFRNVHIIQTVLTNIPFDESDPYTEWPAIQCTCKRRKNSCLGHSCECWRTAVVLNDPSPNQDDQIACESGRQRRQRKQITLPTNKTPFYEKGKVIVPPSVFIVECNSRCSCFKNCGNRVAQQQSRIRMEVVYCGVKGWGVLALEPIEKGQFVMEYQGELLPSEEAEIRGRKYDAELCTTL